MEIREILPWDKPHFCRMVHAFYRLPAVAHAIPDDHAERTFDLLMHDTPYARCFVAADAHDVPHAYCLCAITWSSEAGGLCVWLEELMVEDALREQGACVLFADEADKARSLKKSYEFSHSIPWIVNRELIGATLLLHEHIDGIVLMSAYPCGPDSMCDDAIERCIKGKPILTLTVDAQAGTAGVETRVESFIDILAYQKKGGYLHA